jgi:hypothetical protein
VVGRWPEHKGGATTRSGSGAAVPNWDGGVGVAVALRSWDGGARRCD